MKGGLHTLWVSYRTYIFLLAVLFFVVVGISIFVSTFSYSFSSIEKGVFAYSPAGEAGGKIIPASCPSYAHSPGECTDGGGGGGGGGTGSYTFQGCVSTTWCVFTSPTQCLACYDYNYSWQTGAISFDQFMASCQAYAQGSQQGGYSVYQSAEYPMCPQQSHSACTITASQTTINSGGSSTLTWNCTNQSASSAGGGFSTGGALSGSTTVSPTNTTTYTLQCSSLSCNTSIGVTVLNPTLSISAAPTRVRQGEATAISWSASQVNSCTVTGPSFSRSGTSGSSVSTGAIQAQSTYTLSCETSAGAVSQSVTVTLVPAFDEI